MTETGAKCKEIEENATVLRAQFEELVDQADKKMDLVKVKEVNMIVSSLGTDIDNIKYRIEMELKRQDLEDKLNTVEERHKFLGKNVDKLLADANLEMDKRLKQFNEVYNRLMQKTVSDCRRAYLNSDYMPVINDGEYREASAAVPRRLMYYFTLLNLSLTDADVSFPRFLLVDTPETSGIDIENLTTSLDCIKDVVPKDQEDNYQLILSTGIGKYPSSFRNYIVTTLTEKEKLLKKKVKK